MVPPSVPPISAGRRPKNRSSRDFRGIRPRRKVTALACMPARRLCQEAPCNRLASPISRWVLRWAYGLLSCPCDNRRKRYHHAPEAVMIRPANSLTFFDSSAAEVFRRCGYLGGSSQAPSDRSSRSAVTSLRPTMLATLCPRPAGPFQQLIADK